MGTLEGGVGRQLLWGLRYEDPQWPTVTGLLVWGPACPWLSGALPLSWCWASEGEPSEAGGRGCVRPGLSPALI